MGVIAAAVIAAALMLLIKYVVLGGKPTFQPAFRFELFPYLGSRWLCQTGSAVVVVLAGAAPFYNMVRLLLRLMIIMKCMQTRKMVVCDGSPGLTGTATRTER